MKNIEKNDIKPHQTEKIKKTGNQTSFSQTTIHLCAAEIAGLHFLVHEESCIPQIGYHFLAAASIKITSMTAVLSTWV